MDHQNIGQGHQLQHSRPPKLALRLIQGASRTNCCRRKQNMSMVRKNARIKAELIIELARALEAHARMPWHIRVNELIGMVCGRLNPYKVAGWTSLLPPLFAQAQK
jgi:hypothetical protein